MKAIVIQQYGSSNVLTVVNNMPTPSLTEQQVLIQIQAAGINPLDWKIREGQLKFLMPEKFPLILGNDVSGIIVAIGSQVTNYKVGDHVFCFLDANPKPALSGFAKSGGYAQYAVTRADTLAIKPAAISHHEAATIPLSALTAYQALHHKAHIKQGDHVLINGASGGVGIFAIQIAKAFGAQVTARCSKQNHQLVLQLGADKVMDYQSQAIGDIHETFDIIYDIAVTTRFTDCRKILSKNGVFISNIVNLSSLMFGLLKPLLRGIGILQHNYFAWVKPSGEDLQFIAQLITNQQLRTVIQHTYAMEDIQAAHDVSQTGRVSGKLVINIDHPHANSS